MPDYSGYGFRVESELGRNLAGGRVTYLATHLNTQKKVVIKQFQFAKPGSSWADYDAHHQEIEILRRLNHPGIPRYLGSIATQDGFCMVQEYKHALSLATPYSFTPQEIQKIAVSVLEILIYLQNLIPSVIHGDIRPENILVDDQINVFLVDFGFAYIGTGETAEGSGIRGTLGFMPPEQLFHRQLTEASDLYSLGVTLLCLTTGTQSVNVGNLVDLNYRVKFKNLGSKLNVRWVNWLRKMVAPKPGDRFPNAAAALAAMPGDLVLPEVILSQTELKCVATRLNQRLTHTIHISNPIPNTLLGGVWEVASHPSDSFLALNGHPWISFSPAVFDSNQVECQITVDTSRLMANRCYTRKLLLHTNALAKTYTFSLQVQTAPVPVKLRRIPYQLLGALLAGCGTLTWLMAWIVVAIGGASGATITTGFGTVMGAAVGFELVAWILATAGVEAGAAASVVAGVVVGLTALGAIALAAIPGAGTTTVLMMGALTGIIGSLIGGIALGITAEKLSERHLNKTFSLWTSLFAAATGMGLGIGVTVGFLQGWVIAIVASTSLPLAAFLLHFRLKQAKFMANYRKAERYLIKS
ncbi:serine/threonine protein kinase [Oculatella sp. LEGE 06141]|uniref:serine/threonine protein kinase n=1 Tax=Oculatella sp. LEGE 06141 TaxID=1828648 RepID=UPI0030D966D2